MNIKKDDWVCDLESLDHSGLVKIIDRIKTDLNNGNLKVAKSRLMMVYSLLNEGYEGID